MARASSVPGDVALVKLEDGFAYLQYIGVHPIYSVVIAVGARSERADLKVGADLFRQSYVAFYQFRGAVRHGLIEVVGHLPPPAVPMKVRRPVSMGGGVIKRWIIEENGMDTLTKDLSRSDLELPIMTIWNHGMLLQRISQGWRPVHESK